MASPDLASAIRDLAAQKDEHRELVRQIAADPGMSPNLRELLLSHIYEEETEKVQALQGLAGGGNVPGVSGSLTTGATPEAMKGLTVGSLRGQPNYPQGPSVGSLRGF